MKKDMSLEGLRWSCDSGSALYDTPPNGRSRTGWGGCSCLSCTNQANKAIIRGCSCLSCTNKTVDIFCSVGALETSAPPESLLQWYIRKEGMAECHALL